MPARELLLIALGGGANLRFVRNRGLERQRRADGRLVVRPRRPGPFRLVPAVRNRGHASWNPRARSPLCGHGGEWALPRAHNVRSRRLRSRIAAERTLGREPLYAVPHRILYGMDIRVPAGVLDDAHFPCSLESQDRAPSHAGMLRTRQRLYAAAPYDLLRASLAIALLTSTACSIALLGFRASSCPPSHSLSSHSLKRKYVPAFKRFAEVFFCVVALQTVAPTMNYTAPHERARSGHPARHRMPSADNGRRCRVSRTRSR